MPVQSELQKQIKVVADISKQRVQPISLTSPEAVKLFSDIVNRFPPDFFGAESVPMLEQYVRHVLNSREIDGIIQDHLGYNGKGDAEWTEMFDRLTKMAARESGCIASLATKLRISNQATTNHRANRIDQSKKPWEK